MRLRLEIHILINKSFQNIKIFLTCRDCWITKLTQSFNVLHQFFLNYLLYNNINIIVVSISLLLNYYYYYNYYY